MSTTDDPQPTGAPPPFLAAESGLVAPLPSEIPPGVPLSTPDPALSQTRPDELEVRRDRLAGELAQLQWDLGGLTYEMAIRDHFRLDVLVRQAARLQEIDAELADTERLLRLGSAGASGTCPQCAALYARGAGFCWRCGTQLLEPTTPAAVAG